MPPATKHRGIIFTGESVRAILAGRKTQTRRVVKPQPTNDTGGLICCDDEETWMDYPAWVLEPVAADLRNEWTPPHRPGDVVYVKETWKPHCDESLWTCVKYAADGVCIKPTGLSETQGYWLEAREDDPRWRSPFFMPRYAARLWLRIDDVRCERVQSISVEDAIAEGMGSLVQAEISGGQLPMARVWFQKLWNSINGKTHPWESNPWVWAYTFSKTVAELQARATDDWKTHRHWREEVDGDAEGCAPTIRRPHQGASMSQNTDIVKQLERLAAEQGDSTPLDVRQNWRAILAHIRELERDRNTFKAGWSRSLDDLTTLRQRLAEQQAIIDKLPKTADGVPVVPGMHVWRSVGEDPIDDDEHLVTGVINFNACEECDGDGQEAFMSAVSDCHPECDRAIDTASVYSTREAAAIAAKEEK